MLALEDESWFELASGFGKNYQGAVGSLEELTLFASHAGYSGETFCRDVCINRFIDLNLQQLPLLVTAKSTICLKFPNSAINNAFCSTHADKSCFEFIRLSGDLSAAFFF